MVKSLFSTTAPARSVVPTTTVLAAMLVWCIPSHARAWTLGPPPPLPPLPADQGTLVSRPRSTPRWELVSQKQKPLWERVPSDELILVSDTASSELLGIADGPAAVELIQYEQPMRRWELVDPTAPSRATRRADRLEIMRIQPVTKVPVALVAEQPLGQQAISAPCSSSLCNLRVMGRVWFRF